jgi:autotransporter translocation and assembly factor TamB
LSGLSAHLTFSQATVLIDHADGRVDGGTIRGSGQVLLEGWRPSTIALDATLQGVRPHWSYPKYDLQGLVNGELRLEGRPDHMTLRGSVDLERPDIVPTKLDFQNLIGRDRQELAVYDPTSEVLFFDVGVKLRDPVRDPIRLHNDALRMELTGDLTLTGSNQRLGLLGTLIARPNGSVNFVNRVYSLESGTVDFQDRFRFFPRYDLTLSTRACDAQISVNVQGTLESFSLQTSSKPELDGDTERMQCLTAGVRQRQFEQVSLSSPTGVGIGILTEASGLNKQVKKYVPVDQIDFPTEYSAKQRLYEPRVYVAKEVLEGKVRLELASSLARSDDRRVAVRYRISPELTFQFNWRDSQNVGAGNAGADLRYRWEW